MKFTSINDITSKVEDSFHFAELLRKDHKTKMSIDSYLGIYHDIELIDKYLRDTKRHDITILSSNILDYYVEFNLYELSTSDYALYKDHIIRQDRHTMLIRKEKEYHYKV